MAIPSEPRAVNLLWTGGWDSTYRLLSLVLIHRARVQPIYVVDPERPSTLAELDAMTAIRQRLLHDHPEVSTLLLPVALTLVSDIPAQAEIESWHRVLQQRNNRFPNQYNWLARLAAAQGISDLELCVEKKPGGIVYEGLRGMTEIGRDEVSSTEFYRVTENPGTPELRLFQRFRFPLLEVDKVEMGRVAGENGFGTYLEMTWFCHPPIHGQPCGSCSPCRDTADAGLTRRIPWRNRIIRRYVTAKLAQKQGELMEFLRPRRRLKRLLGRTSEPTT